MNNNVEKLAEDFEKLACVDIGHVPAFTAFTERERLRLAAMLGYVDARYCVNLMQTFGLPLEITLDRASKYGLVPDWTGIYAEFVLQLGLSTDSAKRKMEALRREYVLSHGTGNE